MVRFVTLTLPSTDLIVGPPHHLQISELNRVKAGQKIELFLGLCDRFDNVIHPEDIQLEQVPQDLPSLAVTDGFHVRPFVAPSQVLTCRLAEHTNERIRSLFLIFHWTMYQWDWGHGANCLVGQYPFGKNQHTCGCR